MVFYKNKKIDLSSNLLFTEKVFTNYYKLPINYLYALLNTIQFELMEYKQITRDSYTLYIGQAWSPYCFSLIPNAFLTILVYIKLLNG